MPNAVKITGRTSSITNSFVNGIVPNIIPTMDEISQVLEVLGMNEKTIRCSYCGDLSTEWDHFNPLIRDKRQTGYITEIHNLVPACGKCNQSKGNSIWKDWIQGSAKLSPSTRNVDNLDSIIERLKNYEEWSNPVIINFEEIVGKEVWEQHWRNCDGIHEIMRESQILSDEIKLRVAQKVKENSNKLDPIEKKIIGPDITIVSEKKVGLIAITELREILEKGYVTEEVVKLLTTEQFTKQKFNLNYPLLKKVVFTKTLSKQIKDYKGYNRYYKLPVIIHGEKYLLCSEWLESDRLKLMNWILTNNK